jgi:hypothetical protein
MVALGAMATSAAAVVAFSQASIANYPGKHLAFAAPPAVVTVLQKSYIKLKPQHCACDSGSTILHL